MQTGQGASGMQTMNQALYKLYRAGHIALDEAMARSLEPAELQTMIEQNVNIQSGERRPR
jgi:twitching motility protein PilT